MKHACPLIAILILTGCENKPPQLSSAPLAWPVRVVTWNIHGCRGGLDEVVRELKNLDADVVCLQEAEANSPESRGVSQAQLVAQRLGMDVAEAGSPLNEGSEQRMAILVRPRDRGNAPPRLIERFEPLDAETGRCYGVTGVVSVGGSPIRIVTVHLTGTFRPNWAHLTETGAARLREARDLSRRIDGWSEPVILCGDFNSTPGKDVEVRLLEKLSKAPASQPTYPSEAPVVQIDFVLHSSALRTLKARVLESTVSDHRPVVVQFDR